MLTVIAYGNPRDLARIAEMRSLLPGGVSLIVQDTLPTTPAFDPVLAISLIQHETPPLLKLKDNDSPRAWYRRFERKSRK